jgi:hypothetical protein
LHFEHLVCCGFVQWSLRELQRKTILLVVGQANAKFFFFEEKANAKFNGGQSDDNI